MWPNPVMSRSKSVRQGDDVALTKAAAWAWHQRTTSSTGRVVHPFEADTPPPKQRRPSRHKLEADAAAAAAVGAESDDDFQPPLTRSGSLSLLDGYEIRRISLELDRHIMEAKSFREAPKKPPPPGRRAPPKKPQKSTKLWARRLVGFFTWRSNRVGEESAFAPTRRRK